MVNKVNTEMLEARLPKKYKIAEQTIYGNLYGLYSRRDNNPISNVEIVNFAHNLKVYNRAFRSLSENMKKYVQPVKDNLDMNYSNLRQTYKDSKIDNVVNMNNQKYFNVRTA